MATVPRTDTAAPKGIVDRPRKPQGRNVPVVEFDDVTKVYDGGSVGLERVSMRIGRGGVVFLVGPTGCGNSTGMRLLMKELEPSAGRISIAGRHLDVIPRKRVPYLRRNIGVVFQDYRSEERRVGKECR